MILPFGPKRAPGWLAVCQRGEDIDIAHVVRGPAGVRVTLCETHRGTGGAQAALVQLRRARGLARYRCTTLLQAADYQINAVDAPNVPPDERLGAARWRVKDMLDYPIDAATIDVFDIPVEEGARVHQLYAVSARSEIIERTVRHFQDAGVPLVAIDVPDLAQRNVAALFEEPDRGLAFLAFDATGGLLTVTYRGELYLTRRIDIPQQRLIEADADTRPQLHERIALEVQRSLDHLDRQYGFITLSRLLVAPMPAETGLADYLAGNLYVKLGAADLADVLDIAGAPDLAEPARQAQCLQIIGAGLRDTGALA